jgi:hypothetical protein
MAASSVTGTGPGESNGKQKPHLHSGCGCCGPAQEQASPVPVVRKGCRVRYSSGYGGKYRIKSVISRNNSCF